MRLVETLSGWITSVISGTAQPSVGPVMVSIEGGPRLPPNQPPHKCAVQAQDVERTGAQLQIALDQYQTAVESFTACMESTLVTSSNFKADRNNVGYAIKWMRQNLTASRALLAKMQREQ